MRWYEHVYHVYVDGSQSSFIICSLLRNKIKQYDNIILKSPLPVVFQLFFSIDIVKNECYFCIIIIIHTEMHK